METHCYSETQPHWNMDSGVRLSWKVERWREPVLGLMYLYGRLPFGRSVSLDGKSYGSQSLGLVNWVLSLGGFWNGHIHEKKKIKTLVQSRFD